jgi:hypothetical protein
MELAERRKVTKNIVEGGGGEKGNKMCLAKNLSYPPYPRKRLWRERSGVLARN